MENIRPKGMVRRMEEYRLNKMNRKELLELLLQQVSENEAMKEQIEALKTEITDIQRECDKRLADRQIELSKAGTMAEAALQLNRVFADADLAVRQYHENIKQYSDNAEATARAIVEKAKQEAAKILGDAQKQASRVRLEADEYQKGVKEKMKVLYSSYEGLQSILGNQGGKQQ